MLTFKSFFEIRILGEHRIIASGGKTVCRDIGSVLEDVLYQAKETYRVDYCRYSISTGIEARRNLIS